MQVFLIHVDTVGNIEIVLTYGMSHLDNLRLVVVASIDGRVVTQRLHLVGAVAHRELGGPLQPSHQILGLQFQLYTLGADITDILVSLGIADDRRHGYLVKHVADVLDVVVDSKGDAIVEQTHVNTEVP